MNNAKFDTHQSCLVCNSKRVNHLEKYSKDYLVQCGDCSFVFAERIPTTTELIAHYDSYGRNDYLSPITVKRFHEILDFLEPYRKTNNLIDVGCGIGHFLNIAKERGWNVYGTEFTNEAMKICQAKGISMQQGVLNPENYKKDFFDVIVSFEVIEHINNPLEEVNNFNKILRSGGAVYLTTPNFNSISRYLLKEKWSVIEYPEHLCYYTPQTLNNLFSKFSFRKKWIKTTGVNLSRFQKSLSKKQGPEKGADGKNIPVSHEKSKDEQLRKQIESNKVLTFAKVMTNSFLAISEKGDSMKALFEKKL